MSIRRPRHRPREPQTRGDCISIAAPPEAVWDLITAIDTIPSWYDAWDGVDHDATTPQLQFGTSFQLIRRGRGGRGDTAHCRVTHLARPASLEWQQSAPDTPTVTVQFRLIPAPDGSTTELHHSRMWAAP